MRNTTFNILNSTGDYLDFYGNHYINLSSVPDISSNRKIQFSTWFDTSIWTAKKTIINFASMGGADEFVYVDLKDSSLRVWIAEFPTSPNEYYVKLNNAHINVSLNWEINKTYGAVSNIKINNINCDIVTSALVGGVGGSSQFIGGNTGLQNLSSATLWDIRITNADTSTVIHYWKGYQYGNTSQAWKDQVGNINGTIVGTNPRTRHLI